MLYKDLNRNVNLYDLIDLVHVPEVNRVFASMLERLKQGDLLPCIRAYQSTRVKYFKELYLKNRRAGQQAGRIGDRETTHFYWFELTRYDSLQWRITYMKPVPKDYLNRNKILPPDIIEQITGELVNPDKIITIKAAYSDSFNKTVDLQFVRYSDCCLYGTVKEHPGTVENRDNNNPVISGDTEMAYQVFFQYIQKFPNFSKFVIHEHLKGMVPALTEIEKYLEKKHPKRKPEFSKAGTPDQDFYIPGEQFDDNQDVNLYYLVRFSHIPEVSKAFALKLEELKSGKIKDKIHAYKSRCEEYFQSMFQRFSRREKKLERLGYPRLYWFDLSKYARADWGLTRIQPKPPPHLPYYLILPDDIIRCITTFHTPEPDRVVTLKALPSLMLNKKVDLSFVYFSSNHLFGTVKEYKGDWEYRFTGKFDDVNRDRELDYRLFLHYLYKYPTIKKAIIESYLERGVPFLKKREQEKSGYS